ncbi:hypothetical protein [Streptomyces phaeochromogenes]|uniref:hypothetical protein n=1 Tax=Streptomyces phaeochromogenes TaxID=1923 RepID=UPI0033D07E0B
MQDGPLRGFRTAEPVVVAQPRKALKDEERRARQAVLADHPRPVRWWSQQRLGAHPAIPGRAVAGTEFVLPTFVPRSHDAQLRKIVSAACAEGASSRFVVICGASGTGKSRSACEALAAVPDDFDLIFPADSEGLLAALAADALGPRTVLWLNEAHDYFDSLSAPPLQLRCCVASTEKAPFS